VGFRWYGGLWYGKLSKVERVHGKGRQQWRPFLLNRGADIPVCGFSGFSNPATAIRLGRRRLAITGGGKTNVAQLLLLGLLNKDIPFLVVNEASPQFVTSTAAVLNTLTNPAWP